MFTIEHTPILVNTVTLVWPYNLENTTAFRGNANSSPAFNPERRIVHFEGLRIRSTNLYLEINESSYRFERGIRVKKLAHSI